MMPLTNRKAVEELERGVYCFIPKVLSNENFMICSIFIILPEFKQTNLICFRKEKRESQKLTAELLGSTER